MRRTTLFPQFPAPSDREPPFEPLGSARLSEQTSNSVRLQSARTLVEVTALAGGLFRVGMFGEGRRVDYRSEAVDKHDWPGVTAHISASSNELRIGTGASEALIRLDPLRIGFSQGDRTFALDDYELGMGFAPLAPRAPSLVDPLVSPAFD